MVGTTASNSAPSWLKDYEQNFSGQHSEQVFSHLTLLSQEEIANRAKEIRRLLRTSGYGTASNTTSWQPDPIPYLMSAEDWSTISNGLVQRLGLLQRILTDLHSEQTLISEGLLAPNLLMAHPAYLPEAAKFSPSPMLLAGFDIARQPDGQFTLIRDHLQFPEGLGVQLENRIISRRVMSEEFAELGIERIAHFFKHIQHSLGQFTTENRAPRVVILSEGPDSSNYAEQAYLTTFMDLTLARSADLTVREGKVWIKALEGLQRVDVVIRWIPDDLLDSLEQPQYSEIGVPGLFSAIRAKNVIVINGPGASMLQIPSVHQAIPSIAQYWLGQPLLLPQLDIRLYSDLPSEMQADYELSHFTQPNWVQEASSATLNASPSDLFWRQKARHETAPFWSASGLQALPFYLRCFAFWDGEQVSVLPASLCTTVDPVNSKAQIESTGSTKGIKDTWVPTVGPQKPSVTATLNVPDAGADIALIEGLIPSRAAENLFWLGTSLERCENMVRLLRVYIDRFTELSMYPDERHSWSLSAIKKGILEQTLVYPYKQSKENNDETMPHKQVVWQCLTNANGSGALINAIGLVLSSAKQIRELLSYDTFRIIDTLQSLYTRLQELDKSAPLHSMQNLLDKIIAQVMAFNGSILDSLSLSSGAFMLEMGRRLERSTQLNCVLQALLIDVSVDREQMGALDAVLLTQVSAVTHRRRYRIKHNVETGIELLIVDAQYPRSLAFQIEQMLALSEHLPTHKRPGFLNTPTKLLLQLKTSCALAEPNELAVVSEEGRREALKHFLVTTQDVLLQFKERMQIRYFSHTQPASKLAWSELSAPQETTHEV
jgi:uncharacterized circularly permuted ATP-grasp superfamily protein/uncharacterized alpha-E superfamily protein